MKRTPEGVAMKTMLMPAGTEHIQFDELAHLIADALFPSTGDEDERMDYALTCIEYENELSAAAHSGALQVNHPRTFGPHPYPVGRALQDALVSVNDLRAYLIGRPIAVDIAPEQSLATPAPVVPASDGSATLPAGPNWKMLVQAEATAHCLRLRKAGANPTKNSILDSMAQWCRENDIRTDTKINPSAGYLKTHVLGGKHWEVPN